MGYLIVMVALIAAMVGGGMWMDSTNCHDQWADSGYRSQWGAFSGCRIETKSGKWLPADLLRKLDDK